MKEGQFNIIKLIKRRFISCWSTILTDFFEMYEDKNQKVIKENPH